MAYQALNIVGSFTAGATVAQREAAADRDRADAYRALMRSQLQDRMGTLAEEVTDVKTDDRMQIGDAPQDRRNPYLFLRYQGRPKPQSDDGESAPNSLDTVV